MSILSTDTFIRADQSGWGTSSGGETWAQTAGSATPSIVSNAGQITGATGSNLMILGNNASNADVEGLVRFSISASGDQAGIVIRSGATNSRVEITGTFVRLRASGSVVGTTTISISTSTFYWARFHAIGSIYRAKIWQDGSGEPSDWTASWTDSSNTGAGKYGLFANCAASGDTIKFDTFSVTDAPSISRTVPATAALQETRSRTVTATASLQETRSRTVPATAALQETRSRTVTATASLQETRSRTVPATVSLLATLTRTVPATAALQQIASRTLPATASLKLFGVTRSIPTTASLHALTLTMTSKGRHFPPDGFYVYDAISPNNPSTYNPRLSLIAQAGFKGVLNYSNLYVTASQLSSYINSAASYKLNVIIALNEAPLWNGTVDVSGTYPDMCASAGTTTGPGLTQYVINLVKTQKNVWGYYVGDEVAASNHSLLKTHADLVKATDGNKPRLLIDGVLDSATFSSGDSIFYDCCDVGGSDHYPVGSYDGSGGSPQNGLDKTAGYAAGVQSAATLRGFDPAFVCQAFSYQRYYPPARCSPYPACAPFPSRYKMRQERDAVLANMYPRIVLVYSFFDTVLNAVSLSNQDRSNLRDVAYAYCGTKLQN